MRLKDKVAVVTGAGSGLGRAISVKLAAEGCRVAIADISLKNAEETVQVIKNAGGDAAAFVADITNEEQVQKLFAEVAGTWGKIDLLYNNAGISPVGTIETTSFADFRK